MRILKPLLLFISIYAVFMGCSKKDPVAAVCYLDKSTSTNGSFTAIATFTYTDNKVTAASSITSDGTTGADNYNYDSQGRITSATYSSTNGTSTSTVNETITYDTKGRLIQRTSATWKVVYTYNSSDQMVKNDQYNFSNSTYTLYYSSTYSYPSTSTKNYSTQMDYDGSNAWQATSTFTYDTKQNPVTVLFPTYPEPTNNITQKTLEYPGNTPTIVTYNYTYNANGFPLTVIEKGNNYTSTLTYSYTNCK